ncbi:hypothetical protein SAMN02745121_03844 [Nannocystis exedens]|uniref:Streptogramin lyase n=1 Tax=Nannocystis exedens TaxID=54 RepID=A0A1I1ZQJ3_9BACT|nr:lyase [Nannocystis exedens]PCC75430.1 lyase [Nannocystis exedens]SFE32650.1 hypothetical protein SAMN02745121_03844 [Nannocystis exedens]
MRDLRVLTCPWGLVVSLAALACGDAGSTTASASETQGSDATTTPSTTTTTGTPTTTDGSAASDTASGTMGDTQGQTTTTTAPTSTSSPTSTTTDATSTTTGTGTTTSTTTGTTDPIDTSTSSGGNTTDPFPCQPGETEGMGDIEKSFLWVANSDQGTISKVDTQGVVELARYRSGPDGENYLDNPSRTAVSVDGRFVVVNNRQSGWVTMIAANLEDCVDKNGNGMIETSQNPADILPWGSDECIRWSTQLPIQVGNIGAGPRGVTWTPGTWDMNLCQFVDPKVWVGYLPQQFSTAHMARLDGETGVVEETVTIPNWIHGWADYGPYGAALDKDLNVWFTGLRGELFRINTQMGNTLDRWLPPGGDQLYGMTVDPDGDPWFGNCSGPVSTFNPMNNQFTSIAGTNACHRGLAADKEGAVWVASNGPCGVAQIDHVTNTLIQFHSLNPCSTPVGVSVDDEGFVWVVDEYQGAWKIDPLNPNMKQFLPIAGDHYTYSDMTGGQLKSVVLPQ